MKYTDEVIRQYIDETKDFDFNQDQKFQINECFKSHLPIEQIKSIAKPDISAKKMSELRKKIEENLSIGYKEKPTIQDLMKISSQKKKSTKKILKQSRKNQIKR